MDIDIMPPVSYEEQWMNYFFIALAVVAVYVLLVLIFTRKKKAKAPRTMDINSQEYKEFVRRKHMTGIEELRALNANGELSDADLNQRLGVILRAFASEYSGLNTRPMTLSELRRSQAPKELVDAIANFYPIAFRNLAEGGNPNFAIQEAIEVVYRWN